MKFKIKDTYPILAFCIIIIQLFYDYPNIIFFAKTPITFISLVILFRQVRLSLSLKYVFIYLYLISVFLSYIYNINSVPPKDFLVGLSILFIPIGFLNALLINKTEPLVLNNDLFKIQTYITYGAGLILLYTSIFGSFTEFEGLGVRFMTRAISPSVIALNANLILIFCLLNIGKKNIFFYTLLIVVSFALLVLSISKSGIVISILALLYVGFMRKKYIHILIAFLIITIAFLILLPHLPALEFLSNYLDKDPTQNVSGRSVIWETCEKLINDNFSLGYGYNSAARILTKKFQYFLVEQAHNAYYESMINIGFLGTSILGIYITKVLIKAIRYFSQIRGNTVLSYSLFIIIMQIVRGYTEASFCQANNVIEVTIFLLSIFIIDYYPYSTAKSKLNYNIYKQK